MTTCPSAPLPSRGTCIAAVTAQAAWQPEPRQASSSRAVAFRPFFLSVGRTVLSQEALPTPGTQGLRQSTHHPGAPSAWNSLSQRPWQQPKQVGKPPPVHPVWLLAALEGLSRPAARTWPPHRWSPLPGSCARAARSPAAARSCWGGTGTRARLHAPASLQAVGPEVWVLPSSGSQRCSCGCGKPQRLVRLLSLVLMLGSMLPCCSSGIDWVEWTPRHSPARRLILTQH